MPVENREIAKIFYEIASFLEMEDVAFKPYAYQKAGLTIEGMRDSLSDIYKKGGEQAIEKIPGIGKSIAKKIVEYLKTGKIKYYQDYKRKYPIDIQALTSVEGVGPKMVGQLYRDLGITNLEELRKAAETGKVRKLPNFGEKTERNILQAIKFAMRSKGRFLLSQIFPYVESIKKELSGIKGVKKVSVCGSVRRMEETIGDIDFLVMADRPKLVMDFFCSQPKITKIWGKGPTKSSIRLKEGFDVDLRIVSEGSYGSALQYFTGSKEHNIHLRKVAIEKGLKLNEYGLFKGKRKIASKTEEDVYMAMGMACPPPEIRTDRGEIEAALSSFQGKKGLPDLIRLKDIKGDLHCHSDWDGGKDAILEMAQSAIGRGYEYIGISDHTKFLKIEHGLDERKLSLERKEIDRLNLRFKKQGINFKILQGAELNILKNGSVDIADSALRKLDYAIAGIHSDFKMSKEEMTERIIKAMKNPYIKIIAHPTGRILKKREGYSLDINKIFRLAKETGTILEINSCPERLDLNDLNIRKAIGFGLKLVINTDAHQKEHLCNMVYGVSQARRGWAEKKDIINTYSLKKLLGFLKKN